MRPDLKLHLYVGVGMVLATMPFVPLAWAVAWAVFVGAAKEVVWDKWLKRGTPAWDDFLVTAGAAVTTGVAVEAIKEIV